MFHPPFDLVLSDYDVVQPDLLYFGAETAARINPDEYVRFPPDLGVEILSASTASVDRGRKRDLLARHGLREYWVVDPVAHRIEVSVLGADGYGPARIVAGGFLASVAIAGLTIDLAMIFDGL